MIAGAGLVRPCRHALKWLHHGARDELQPRLVLRIRRRWLDKMLVTASPVVAFGNLANHDGARIEAALVAARDGRLGDPAARIER